MSTTPAAPAAKASKKKSKAEPRVNTAAVAEKLAAAKPPTPYFVHQGTTVQVPEAKKGDTLEGRVVSDFEEDGRVIFAKLKPAAPAPAQKKGALDGIEAMCPKVFKPAAPSASASKDAQAQDKNAATAAKEESVKKIQNQSKAAKTTKSPKAQSQKKAAAPVAAKKPAPSKAPKPAAKREQAEPFTPAQVEKMRALRKEGLSYKAIGERFGLKCPGNHFPVSVAKAVAGIKPAKKGK